MYRRGGLKRLPVAVIIPLLYAAVDAPVAVASPGTAWLNFFNQSYNLEERNHPESALNYGLQALREAEKFDNLDPRYTETLRTVARLNIQLGRLSAAESYLKREAEALRQMGPDFPSLDFDFFWLGVIQEKRGELKEAEKLYLDALRVATRFVKEGFPRPGSIYARLCAIANSQHRVAEAKAYAELAARSFIERAASARKRMDMYYKVRFELDQMQLTLEKKNPGLADGYRIASRQMLLAAYDEVVKIDGRQSEMFCQMICEMAERHYAANQVEKAEEYANEGLGVLMKLFPKDHETRYKCRSILTLTLVRLGRLSEAEKVMRLAFDDYRLCAETTVRWNDYPANCLADAYLQAGDLESSLRVRKFSKTHERQTD